MKQDEMIAMCDKLSYKYKSAQMREDLVQEGVLACLEILAEEDNPHPAKLYRAADKAMWDHLNFSALPVRVPVDKASRALMRGSDVDKCQSYSEDGIEVMKEAVTSVSVEYDDTMMMVDDYSAKYEKKEYEAYVKSKVFGLLSGDELEIIKLRYYENMTQTEVADLFGVKQATISRKEKQALERLRKKL